MKEDSTHTFSVGISVSPCDEAAAIGYDERQINRITVRIAQYFLFKGMRVVFGHDWRGDGVMRAVGEFAEMAAVGRITDDDAHRSWRMLNVVPATRDQLNRAAKNAEETTKGILRVVSLYDLIYDQAAWGDFAMPGLLDSVPPRHRLVENPYMRLWVLRRALTELLQPGFRICLGGKTKGYTGCYAGVAEEAFFALKYSKPLYLIGGFGGATGAVCAALLGRKVSHSDTLTPAVSNPAEWPNMPPVNGLAQWFQRVGIDKLVDLNGLSPCENEELFEITDIETAFDLISKGLRRLMN